MADLPAGWTGNDAVLALEALDDAPVPLRLKDLPSGPDDAPCVWVASDGRPYPVRVVRLGDDMIHGWRPADGCKSMTLADLPRLYPESAAPALWRAYLAQRVGVAHG